MYILDSSGSDTFSGCIVLSTDDEEEEEFFEDDDIPFSCLLCGAIFASIRDLHTHTRTHIMEAAVYNHHDDLFISQIQRKSHACTTCGKKFVDAARLRRHVQIVHIEEKPFHCTVCRKSFATQKEMELHMPSHQHECTWCHMVFTRKQGIIMAYF